MSSDLDKLIKAIHDGIFFFKKMVSFYNESTTRKSAVVNDVSMVVQNVVFPHGTVSFVHYCFDLLRCAFDRSMYTASLDVVIS